MLNGYAHLEFSWVSNLIYDSVLKKCGQRCIDIDIYLQHNEIKNEPMFNMQEIKLWYILTVKCIC